MVIVTSQKIISYLHLKKRKEKRTLIVIPLLLQKEPKAGIILLDGIKWKMLNFNAFIFKRNEKCNKIVKQFSLQFKAVADNPLLVLVNVCIE